MNDRADGIRALLGLAVLGTGFGAGDARSADAARPLVPSVAITRTATGGDRAAFPRIPSVATTGTATGEDHAALEVPVEIRGRKVNYKGNQGSAVFTGGVTVNRGTAQMTCDELETIRGSSEAIARGHVVLVDREREMDLTCDEVAYTHGLRQANARGSCQLISGVGDDVTVVTSSSMQIFLDTREATAHENVRIVQGPNEARCTDAHLYGAEDRVVLTGRPVLRHPPHEFVCDQVVTYFKAGRSILTGSVTGKMTLAGIEDIKKDGLTP